jgi:peptide methionine sulfoxide reductase msrA/msrB
MKKIIIFLAMSILAMAEQKDTNRTVISPLGGKEVLVVEAQNCKFCKKFHKEVLDNYKGKIPLRIVNKNDIRGKGFKLNKIKGTPTIILIKDGKEVYSYTGYMEEKLFYKALDILKDKIK